MVKRRYAEFGPLKRNEIPFIYWELYKAYISIDITLSKRFPGNFVCDTDAMLNLVENDYIGERLTQSLKHNISEHLKTVTKNVPVRVKITWRVRIEYSLRVVLDAIKT